jgi:hypothetical protein
VIWTDKDRVLFSSQLSTGSVYSGDGENNEVNGDAETFSPLDETPSAVDFGARLNLPRGMTALLFSQASNATNRTVVVAISSQ